MIIGFNDNYIQNRVLQRNETHTWIPKDFVDHPTICSDQGHSLAILMFIYADDNDKEITVDLIHSRFPELSKLRINSRLERLCKLGFIDKL